MNKISVKTQIGNMNMELSNDTGNNTKYVLNINYKNVYTHECLNAYIPEFCNFIDKYYDGDLSATEVLDKLIMMYREAEAQAPVEEFVPITCYPNYYDFSNEDVVNEDLTVPESKDDGVKVKPVVPVVDDYDYSEYEVKPRFCNWDGSPMESLY